MLGHYWGAIGLATVVLAAGSVGCSTSNGSAAAGPVGATAGTAGRGSPLAAAGSSAAAGMGSVVGNGGGPPGAAGATLVLGDSKTEACIGYALAQCERISECRGSWMNCTSLTLTCPDLTLATGSTRTVAGLKECAEQFRVYPCDRLLAGYPPPCVLPGTIQQGEACRFASQCQSLRCSGNNNTCGICAGLVNVGADCSTPDVACAPGTTCNSDSKKCESLGVGGTGSGGTGSGGVPGGAGMSGPTAVLPTLGATCAATRACAAGSYCESTNLVCSALPGKGAACGVDAKLGNDRCADRLACVCPDGTRNCSTFSCVDLRYANESCGTDGAVCHPGFTCTSGVCVPRDSQGLTAACAG